VTKLERILWHRNYSQAKFAVDAGISQPMASQLIHARRRPSAVVRGRICALLGLKPEQIFPIPRGKK
jgi:transcriptional regulator with XRE-family HTH domain